MPLGTGAAGPGAVDGAQAEAAGALALEEGVEDVDGAADVDEPVEDDEPFDDALCDVPAGIEEVLPDERESVR